MGSHANENTLRRPSSVHALLLPLLLLLFTIITIIIILTIISIIGFITILTVITGYDSFLPPHQSLGFAIKIRHRGVQEHLM